MTPSPKSKRALLIFVILAVAAWGAFHVLGGLTSENPRRGLVLACSFAAFLGFWLLMLAFGGRRKPPHPAAKDTLPDSSTDSR